MQGREHLKDIVTAVEKAWLMEVSDFLSEHFKLVFLPSHDLSHHLRTWKNAKSILNELEELNNTIDYELVEALFLATMFHDTGLSVSMDAEHGTFSREIYLDFLKTKNKPDPVLQANILHAIEMHDRKEEFVYTPFTIDAVPDILTITGIADDLDAIGTIGIYRYTEIYLQRGIKFKSLGIKVLENISARFNNLVKASVLLPAFVRDAKIKYQEIITFFDSFNQQILLETEPDTIYTGHIGVVNYIREFCVIGKIRPEHFLDTLNNYSVGNFILNYFEELENTIAN